MITPDTSRSARWQATAEQYVIVHEDGIDYVRREDGKAFLEISFSLTPTYTHLPLAYAPFSPYSNGGTSIHTGRFFSCAERCDEGLNRWNMSLRVPEGDNIILNGVLNTKATQWVDQDGGRNVYVGPDRAVETDHLISVIDESLPEEIKVLLDKHLPELVELFADQLGSRRSKTVLFASY